MEHYNLGIATVTLRRGERVRFAAILAERFGIKLLYGPKASRFGEVSFVGTGPRTYLAVKEDAGWGFADQLCAELGNSAWVCNQFAGYGVLRISGPKIRNTLAKGIPIDFDPVSFRPDDAAVTLAAHFGIVVWQIDQKPTFDIAVSRSFTANFLEWLTEMANREGASMSPRSEKYQPDVD